jgi:hypothetical protein
LKIASKARAVRVTAHFRRLTPPSFAAQNPLQEAAIFIHADVPQGHGGSLSRPAAAFLAAQNPLQEAAIFIHADVPQGHGGSLSRPAAAFLAAQKP